MRRLSTSRKWLYWLALVAFGCATNPVTGRKELAMITEQQEIAMGQQADKEVQAAIGLYPDDDLQNYVARLGKELAARSERPHLPWTFRVVNDAAVNAFALPGGFIYVTRGLLTHLNSEAELVSVLGHEIGHVTARHSVSQISKAQLASLGLGIAMILQPQAAQAYGDLAQTGLSVLFLKYGRDDERQADDLGLRYMVQNGYDPRAMPEVFDVLGRVSQGQGRLPNWLSSHPDPGARAQRASTAVAGQTLDFSRLRIDRDEFLGQIDGVVFGEDPREGYFEGSLFLHPALRFQIRFPEGWKTQNQKQAVVAISPREDAVVALTLAPGESAERAAREFLSQQGIQGRQAWRDRIGGLPATSYTFDAVTQNAQLSGVAAWVEHSGRVFRLLGYTSANRFRNYGDTLAASLASFDRVTDPRVLNVEPRRVDIVKLRDDTTLDEFVREYPSSVPAGTVALINHLDSGEQLAAGEGAKRVTGGPGR